jgi:autotransporter translocation and assembly factor TamB
MKKLSLIILTIGLTFFNIASFAADNSGAIGSWKIVVPDAPYEYSNSTLTITDSAGKLAAKIVFADGQSLTGISVTLSNDVLKFIVNIDGTDIPFNGKIAGNTLTGTVETPDVSLSVKGEKLSLIGLWDYSAPDAPGEYSAGKIVFSEAAGKTAGKVILTGGYEVAVNNLKIDNLSFSFTVEIEYETVKVTGKLANGRISGKAEYPEGVLNIYAVRSKTQK